MYNPVKVFFFQKILNILSYLYPGLSNDSNIRSINYYFYARLKLNVKTVYCVKILTNTIKNISEIYLLIFWIFHYN